MLWAVATLTVAAACGAGAHPVERVTGRIAGKAEYATKKHVVVVVRAQGHIVKQEALNHTGQHFTLRVAQGSYVIALADKSGQVLSGVCSKRRIVVRDKRVARVALQAPCAPVSD